MNDYIGQRAERIAQYMIDNQCTVRQAAGVFCVSKSTIHKDISAVLRQRDRKLYKQVQALLQKNKKERHIRGGMATRQKYAGKK